MIIAVGISFAFIVLYFLVNMIKQNNHNQKIYNEVESMLEVSLFREIEENLLSLKNMEWLEYKKNQEQVKAQAARDLESLERRYQESQREVVFTPQEKRFWFKDCPEYKLKKHYHKILMKEIFKEKIEKLKLLIPDDYYAKVKKLNYYNKNSKKVQNLQKVLSQFNEGISKYRAVQREIKQAKSAISSAETMETIDLFSKNKGLSLLSTLSTSDANSEIEDVKRSLKSLKSYLNNLNMKKVQNAQRGVDDSFDLFIDFVFDPGFDFFSLMNLFSLADASSDLDKLARDISPIGDHLKSSKNKAKEALVKELAQLP